MQPSTEGCCWSRGTDLLVKGFHAFLSMGTCKNPGSQNFFFLMKILKISVGRPVLPVFPQTQSASFLISTLNSFQGVLKISGCRSFLWLSHCSSRWKVPIFSWQSYMPILSLLVIKVIFYPNLRYSSLYFSVRWKGLWSKRLKKEVLKLQCHHCWYSY